MNLYVLGRKIANNRKMNNLIQDMLVDKLNISIDELLTYTSYIENKNYKHIFILIKKYKLDNLISINMFIWIPMCLIKVW